MPSNIQLLDEKTINKIAAGEVIENSSSCVKELVENAIDAGAKKIRVEIVAGGRSLLKVEDDGCGMSAEDAKLCLMRHATSKIRSIEDMDTIGSMGFRGEALASIAAVSKLTLKTSQGLEGTLIKVEGGVVKKVGACPPKQGTTIEVESLFYNVPARKAFQKSIRFDTQQITQLLTHMALAYQEIAFVFVVDHKEIFSLDAHSASSEGLKERIATFYDKELSDQLIPIEMKEGFLSVRGFLGPMLLTRSNHSRQFFYINQRLIQSKLLQSSVDDGYATRLPSGRYAQVFLFITLDPKEVDVNVHPQKKEVRFKKSLEIKHKLSSCIDSALSSYLMSKIEINPIESQLSLDTPKSFASPQAFVAPSLLSGQASQMPLLRERPQEPISTEMELPPHVLGLFDRYIFVEAKSCTQFLIHERLSLDGLLLIDQKAAKERIFYDHLIEESFKEVEVQSMLIPQTLEFSKSEAYLIETHLESLNTLGISIRSLKDGTFLVDGLPAKLQVNDVQSILERILSDLQSHGVRTQKNINLNEVLARSIASCAVYEKKIDSLEVATHLLQKLFKCANPWVSPKGKAIIKCWDSHELAKFFHTPEK